MQVIENASIVCLSVGENNVIVVENELNGEKITLRYNTGAELELGMEGRLQFKDGLMVSFEPIMVEELV
jgi:hypothetical protein